MGGEWEERSGYVYLNEKGTKQQAKILGFCPFLFVFFFSFLYHWVGMYDRPFFYPLSVLIIGNQETQKSRDLREQQGARARGHASCYVCFR